MISVTSSSMILAVSSDIEIIVVDEPPKYAEPSLSFSYCIGANLFEKPQRVIILRAMVVARSISFVAPVVTASVPKVSSSSKFDLIPVAKTLQVKKIFSEAEIYPLLSPEKNDLENPYVDEITHEAVIDVTEKGCEAAAYTMIGVTDESVSADPPYTFTADRPFLYYISDTNGTPLFIGTVNNPTEK